MPKYKAVISDIDGTLTPIIIGASPSPKTVEAINKLKSRNIIFSLATGRPFHLIEKIVKDLNLTAPMITDNGAVITDGMNNILWEAVLPYQEATNLLQICKQYGFTRISTNNCNEDNPSSIPAGDKVRKVSIHDILPEKANKLIDKVGEKYKNICISKSASYKGEKHMDVYFSHAHATKQRAILEYSQLLNINTDEIVGIGDGYNDFPLLMACGLKVAMGNAVEELKEIADYIAPTVEEDGLATVIEKFLL